MVELHAAYETIDRIGMEMHRRGLFDDAQQLKDALNAIMIPAMKQIAENPLPEINRHAQAKGRNNGEAI